ncbi:putative ribonuclease H-like domain-containing protein [Tanacetum coccineum]
MDVKSAFLYGKIEEEVYVCQPPRFEDLDFLDRVYKVEKALYGMKPCQHICWTMGFKEGKLTRPYSSKGTKENLHSYWDYKCSRRRMAYLLVKINMLKKFGFIEVKTASTPMETQKPLFKDEDGEEVDVHMYRSMIGSLMYLTSSRPDIIDYAGASLDRNSTIGGCQFIRCRLISWQCKKETVVANSTTEAEYALTINPTIYTSCIEQFWATAKEKTVNGVVQLQALVDGKKIIVTEAFVRRDLHN